MIYLRCHRHPFGKRPQSLNAKIAKSLNFSKGVSIGVLRTYGQTSNFEPRTSPEGPIGIPMEDAYGRTPRRCQLDNIFRFQEIITIDRFEKLFPQNGLTSGFKNFKVMNDPWHPAFCISDPAFIMFPKPFVQIICTAIVKCIMA